MHGLGELPSASYVCETESMKMQYARAAEFVECFRHM
jgi:hypothetical protein